MKLLGDWIRSATRRLARAFARAAFRMRAWTLETFDACDEYSSDGDCSINSLPDEMSQPLEPCSEPLSITISDVSLIDSIWTVQSDDAAEASETDSTDSDDSIVRATRVKSEYRPHMQHLNLIRFRNPRSTPLRLRAPFNERTGAILVPRSPCARFVATCR